MSNSPLPKMYGIRMLPILLGVTVGLVLAAGALLYFASAADATGPATPAGARLAVLSQSMPLRAQAALRGEEKAFSQLAESRKQLEGALQEARTSEPTLAQEPAWQKLIDESQTVLDGREATAAVAKAAAQVAELKPKLLAEIGNLSGLMSGARAALERFEIKILGVEQDLGALTLGTGDAATAQRLADGVEDLGEVMRGLTGE